MRYLAFVFLSLAVAGCGSSPSEMQYYRLPAVAAKAPVVDSAQVLVIEPVMVAPKRDIRGAKIFPMIESVEPKAPISTIETITMVTLPSIIALSEFL